MRRSGRCECLSGVHQDAAHTAHRSTDLLHVCLKFWGIFYFFTYYIQHCFICPPQIPLWRRMPGSNRTQDRCNWCIGLTPSSMSHGAASLQHTGLKRLSSSSLVHRAAFPQLIDTRSGFPSAHCTWSGLPRLSTRRSFPPDLLHIEQLTSRQYTGTWNSLQPAT